MLRATRILAIGSLGVAAAQPVPAAAASPPAAATAKLGQRARLGGVAVTPVRVEEDSRCPAGVQCIWAGRLRLAVRIRDRGARRAAVLTLGRPHRTGNWWLTLCSARPHPAKGGPVPRAAYRFRFSLGRDGPPDCGAGG